jgi:hypothetical protein
VFCGVGLLTRGPIFTWLRGFYLFRLIVPGEISWLVVIIVVALRFFLKSPRGFSSLTILLRYGTRYLVYLVRMAILFLRGGDRLLFWRDALGLLRSAPEIIVQAYSLINQNILVRREALNSYSVFNIRS